MTHYLKKTLALTLVLCSLVSLCLWAIPTSAAGYAFPQQSRTVEVGQILRGSPNIPGQVDVIDHNGSQYLAVPIKGGYFYVFSLTDYLEGKPNGNGNYVYYTAEDGIGVPRGIAQDSKGNIYVVGDSSNVFWYNIATGASGKISTGGSTLYSVCVDEKDNVFVATKTDNKAAIHQVDISTKTAKQIYSSGDFTQAQGIAAGDGKIFFQGPLKKSAGQGSQIRMITPSGQLTASYALPQTGGSYYLSYVDGVVVLGTDSGSADGLVALDTAGGKLTQLDLGKNTGVMGFVTAPRNGKAYLCLAKDGTYEYDVASRTLSRKVSSICNRPLRARNYVRNGSDMLLLSVGPGSVTTIKGPGSATVSLDGILAGAYSVFTSQSIAPGVPGTGVAVYAGAYLSGAVASYSPDAENPVNSKAFHNGHDQTDSMITYKGKLYAGCYSGAYLVEYDPVAGTVTELIPGLKDAYNQLRIHGLAAGDDKIFFSTIPNDQALGGCIGWYDLTTGQWYAERNVVKDQSVMTLAYDEERDILYGGTTIRGGTNSTPTAKQAVVMAYDVENKRVLATAEVSSLTGDYPRNISGIAQDPDTGIMWGVVAQTVFTFRYQGGRLDVVREWAAPTNPSNPYPDSSGKSWHSRPIVFDGRGGMYIGMNESKYGIIRFTLGSNGKLQGAESVAEHATRIYTIGADGNLYYYNDQLYMVDTGRTGVVRRLIDAATESNLDGIKEARQAYDSLSQKERDWLGSGYADKLATLEEKTGLAEPPTVPETVPETTPTVPETVPETTLDPENDVAILSVKMRIDAIGKVTPGSGSAIQLARQAYDALTAEQQAYVTNVQVLLDAEAAFKALADSVPTDQTDDNSGSTVIIVIVIVAVLAAAGAAVAIILGKKKKKSVGADDHIRPQTEETPAE